MLNYNLIHIYKLKYKMYNNNINNSTNNTPSLYAERGTPRQLNNTPTMISNTPPDSHELKSLPHIGRGVPPEVEYLTSPTSKMNRELKQIK